MLGLMQKHSLQISELLDHAAAIHPNKQVVSRLPDGSLHRYGYADLHNRASRLAAGLQSLGIESGDRVATLAWNSYKHVELYYAVSGIGAVLHTVNPRLHVDQIKYILGHSEPEILFFDADFSGLVTEALAAIPSIRFVVPLFERNARSTEGRQIAYEDVLSDRCASWETVDEDAASSLCYTSGTTGLPKGVLYSHRSTVLHALTAGARWGFDISKQDTVLALVPLFHVNAWGLPYICALSGASLVLPGSRLDGKSIYNLIVGERCTIAFGVPTLWLGLLHYLDSHPEEYTEALALKKIVIGGAAAPHALIVALQETLNCEVVLAWGMTELSPLGTAGVTPRVAAASDRKMLSKQGKAVFGVKLRLVDPDGKIVPHDGQTTGRLLVTGHSVIQNYFRSEEPLLDADGYFETGDVATIDAAGNLEITDRIKDVIKSGGEWISSIEIENAAASHPGVEEAAVVAVSHPRWQERPLLLVKKKSGVASQRDELLAHIGDRVAKWCVPDDVVFVADLPRTATGKIQKTQLREQYSDHLLKSANVV